jgi:molybdopterin-guanine dinucleotide biosynthesis protein B
MTKLSALPIVGIVASSSNAGKTTLITALIPALAKHDVRVSVIKHAHHAFDIDHVGKDSYNIRAAGAVQTLIASGKRWALMTEMSRVHAEETEANLEDLIHEMHTDYADLILVEGFKAASIPKIEVFRPSLNAPLLAAHDQNIIAVATDAPLSQTLTVPSLDLNNVQAIVQFIQQHILK